MAAIARKSAVIVLDFDATDDPIHGNQEGAFYHGYYGDYCCLPLYCFCGDIPLWAQLRTSDRDGADGSLDALKKIVPAIRERFGKHVRIIVRGDSGFCRDEFMTWIEAEPNVHYVLGLARNERLEKMLIPAFWETAEKLNADLALSAKKAGAEAAPEVEGTERTFAELRYQTLKSWACERRVIGKAEITNGKKNPRFIVTDIDLGADWIADCAALADGQSLPKSLHPRREPARNARKTRLGTPQIPRTVNCTSDTANLPPAARKFRGVSRKN